MKHIKLRPEPMTDGAFAPFGQLIRPTERPREKRVLSAIEFACDGKTTIATIWQPHAALSFGKLERHFGVTQTFFQLSGAPAVVCVAPPTDMADPQALPDAQAVRAFLIDSTIGFSFHRGTWHSLDRYVLEPEGAAFVIINVAPNPTQIIDFAQGLCTQFDDLDVAQSATAHPLPSQPALEFIIDP